MSTHSPDVVHAVLLQVIVTDTYLANLLQITPCIGWLNKNATLRRLTTQRAVNLSAVMSDVAVKYKHHWSNLELNYVTNPITTGQYSNRCIAPGFSSHSGWYLIGRNLQIHDFLFDGMPFSKRKHHNKLIYA